MRPRGCWLWSMVLGAGTLACEPVPGKLLVCDVDERTCDGSRVVACREDGRGWRVVTQCDTSCRDGDCTACVPGARRCVGADVEVCDEVGSAFARTESCTEACLAGQCTTCVPGASRCQGDDVIEVCGADGAGFAFWSRCPTACAADAQGARCSGFLCLPFARRCDDDGSVAVCDANGMAWGSVEACSNGCTAGQCNAVPVEVVCTPGDQRCTGLDVEVCNGSGTAWLYDESCLAACVGGRCVGGACRPFVLYAAPAAVRADGASTTLVYSEPVVDGRGKPVADDSGFTVTTTAGQLRSYDQDTTRAGMQVLTTAGVVDVVVQASAGPGLATVILESVANPRCRGSVDLQFTASAARSRAADLSDLALVASGTNAAWHRARAYYDPVPRAFDLFGDGRDGPLLLDNSSATYNLNLDAVPGRTFPDAVAFAVSAIRDATLTINATGAGLVPGDEVVLIQLQVATDTPETSVGLHEFGVVAAVLGAAGQVRLTAPVMRPYDLAGKVMLQRVPHYTDVVVRGTLTANPWDGLKGGLLVLRASGTVVVYGRIDMAGKGYRGGEGWAPDGSGSGPTCCYYEPNGYSYAGCGTHATVGGSAVCGAYDKPHGVADLGRLTMGGGGGNCGIPGASGGGIIFVAAAVLDVPGTIDASGAVGASNVYGLLGGGAGGSIFLHVATAALGTRLRAKGGGMLQTAVTGGDGRIRLNALSLLGGTTSPAYYDGAAALGTWGSAVVLHWPLDVFATSALLHTVLADDVGTIDYTVSNDDGGPNAIASRPGEIAVFPAGSDQAVLWLRARMPLERGRNRLYGVSVTFSP